MITWNNNRFILIKGWANSVISNDIHSEFVNNCELIRNCDEFLTAVGNHPVEQFIENYKINLISIAKQLNSDINDYEYAINCFKHGDGIDVHNDFYENTQHQIRGIIWINPSSVEGTTVYNEERGKPIGMLGGDPGDLLIFESNEDSFHSAINNMLIDRYTVNFTFSV